MTQEANSTQDADIIAAGGPVIAGADKLAALKDKAAIASQTFRPIDFVRAAFSNARRGIEIPEWQNPYDNTPLKLYFSPMTCADLEWVSMGAPESESNHHRNARLIAYKAQVEHLPGKFIPAFTTNDVQVLMREAYYQVMQRVVNFMYEVSVTPAEAEKELQDPKTVGSGGSST